MNAVSKQLQKITREYSQLLKSVTEEKYVFKPLPGKWSKKEILGHLADSAMNNIRRFVVAQYESNPKIVYKQNDWVAIGGYRNYETANLIALWQLLNEHAVIVLANMNDAALQRKCNTNDIQPQTIEWLANDYIKHLLHHLHQILELQPVPYP
ncbi:MAG TPA: DinB family protein [Puia sp.]|nr:DinB family protein [Puia sp.]